LPVSTKNFSLDFVVKQFLKGIPYPESVRNQVWLGSFSPPELDGLLTEDVRAELGDFDYLGDLTPAGEGNGRPLTTARAGWLDQLIYQYCKFYLAGDILFKVDRASMAASLEARAPFLDRDLVEFINRLPPDLKLRGRNGKYLLKRALEGKLPNDVLYRSKKGFGIPVAQWLRKEARPLAEETFSAARLGQAGLFRPDTVGRLLGEHIAGQNNHRKQLWTLLVFALWQESLGQG
jgi:asparagine synthase (glutamine-hydrolysing)